MRPYQVKGQWYTPHAQPDYDEVGLASWYGGAYLNRTTADGEVFDTARPSAAHKTLPLPSLVEVTNLENGRRIQVRINDRGPFISGRIIDFSPRAAQELGFYEKGSARVRVRNLTAPTSPAPPPAYQVQTSRISLKHGRFTVQAGAFADADNAQRALARLQSAGDARIAPLRRGEVTLYRVMLTSDLQPTAQDLRAQVVAAGFPEAKVISAF